jgi:hypothetical protein
VSPTSSPKCNERWYDVLKYGPRLWIEVNGPNFARKVRCAVAGKTRSLERTPEDRNKGSPPIVWRREVFMTFVRRMPRKTDLHVRAERGKLACNRWLEPVNSFEQGTAPHSIANCERAIEIPENALLHGCD